MASPKSSSVKVNITIFLDREAWQRFRYECARRKTTASKEIGSFIRDELTAWQARPASKETNHGA